MLAASFANCLLGGTTADPGFKSGGGGVEVQEPFDILVVLVLPSQFR